MQNKNILTYIFFRKLAQMNLQTICCDSGKKTHFGDTGLAQSHADYVSNYLVFQFLFSKPKILIIKIDKR